MKNPSIRILGPLFKEVHTKVLSTGPDESVAFLTAKYFETGERTIFLAEAMVSPKPEDYLRQGPYHLQVSPLYVNRVLNVAEDQKNTVIMVHNHPFEEGIPFYSPTDDHGEALTSETISKCLERNPPVGSMLFGQAHVTARMWTGLSQKRSLSPVNVLDGTSFHIHLPSPESGSKRKDFVDRQIKALGQNVQAQLEQMDIGVVGLGGTGSAVAEQLARMGVTKLRLVDHEKIEKSNLSRLYGSTMQDVQRKKYKVDVVGSHLAKISPQLDLVRVNESVMKHDVLRTLANCDIIFSCLDRHGPRAVLNELSYQCFVPIIDVGVGLQKDENGIVGGAVRATIIGPGLPCLICQDIVRPEVITAENLSPADYEKRRAEGYVTDVHQNVPSVISYTTLAASLGLIMFTELFVSVRSTSYSTLVMDLESKELLKLRTSIKEECVCKKRLGKGFGIPFSVAD